QDAGILDRTHLRFFTENEIHRMFNSEKYEVDLIKGSVAPEESTASHKEFFDGLLKLVGEDKKLWFDVYQFIIRAKKIM
ncbi:MAG: glycosyl transferase, partial [Butyrivibrio sp.]|nr:glycosyl transferase [Butyrivibrio sp.]